jgi:hypothetical protein
MSVSGVVTTDGKYKAAVEMKPRQNKRLEPWYMCVCDYQKADGGAVYYHILINATLKTGREGKKQG